MSKKNNKPNIMDTTNALIIGRHEMVENRVATKLLLREDGKTWACKVKIIEMDDENLEIDFIGFDCSIVNAFRRLILTEVPTVAIDVANIFYNTSIIPDEMLASRLGLIPVNVHPSLLEFKADKKNFTSKNSVPFDLKVICKTDLPEGSSHNNLTTVQSKVLSSNLTYKPFHGRENPKMHDSKPIDKDIVIAVLNNGQSLDIKTYAIKGIGRDHTKFNAGHCYYRMLPLIELNREIVGFEAKMVQRCFSKGVIGLVKNKDGDDVAKVENARIDSCSRNIFKNDSIKDLVTLGRKSDHFIFYIESQSCLKPQEILLTSIDILIGKCDVLINALNKSDDEEMKDEEATDEEATDEETME